MAAENNNKTLNVPTLRFPEFSGEWESSQLKDECTVNPKTGELEDEFLYIDLESVVNGELIKHNIIQKKDSPSRAQRILHKGDILYQCVRPYQLNNYFVNDESDMQRVASTGYAQIRTSHNPQFVYQLLHTKKITDQVLNRCTGTNYPAINSTDLSNIIIDFPGQKEQIKIASFLRLIDERIAIQNKVIERLQSLIRALAQTLTNKAEEHEPLMSLVNCYTSTLKESDTSVEGEVPVYGASGICGFVEEPMETKDSILITKDGSGVGTVRYVPEKHSFVGTLASLTAKEGVYLPYVYFVLMGFDFSAYKTGLAIPHVYFRDYGKGVIPCPSYGEQVKIAKGLMLYEERLAIEKDVLKKLSEQKSFLLRGLFI